MKRIKEVFIKEMAITFRQVSYIISQKANLGIYDYRTIKYLLQSSSYCFSSNKLTSFTMPLLKKVQEVYMNDSNGTLHI